MTGSGTIGDPYIISDVTDLQNMENDLTAYYELGGNIDASATTTWNAGAGFLPIGQADYFTGQLDGKDYTISGLFINRTDTQQALIYNMWTGAVLQNIKMTNVDITVTGSYGAALVGYMRAGTVTNCSSTGTVTVSGALSRHGAGLIAWLRAGTVSKCWSSCTIVVAYVHGGGLIAYATAGTVDDCYALGSVANGDDYAGGFVGYNQGATINDCYSIGAATGDFGVGGFCGYSTGTETNCFWDTETSGNATDGGSATGKTTAQMKTKATFTDAGWDFTTPIWYISAGVNSGYPAFTAPLISAVNQIIFIG